MINENLKTLYVFAEIKYEKVLQLPREELYPFGWYLTTNYELKLKIIDEAIKEKKLIKDTDLYKETFIGIGLNRKK